MLEKAKKIAENSHETLLSYHILDEERKIETQYITGSSTLKAVQLNEESVKILQNVGVRDRLSNLSIMLYGMYLKYGYVRDKKIMNNSKTIFIQIFQMSKFKNLDFMKNILFPVHGVVSSYDPGLCQLLQIFPKMGRLFSS